ncbi:MAG: N-acylglucosamine 2-epimerase, partial [Propionibacteriales bacterium]|nr:N-acylglucosamine 2-epimerase [Propionibacteriales bacterium]
RDDKVVAAWNGWAIAALAEAGMVLGRPEWVEHARLAAEHVWSAHWVDERLRRTSRDGRPSAAPAVAEDHAALAHGLGVLAQATGDPVWLGRAEQLLILLDEHFAAEDGGLYDTADDAEQLYARPRDLAENATPSGASAALMAYRLHARLTGLQRWTDRANAISATTTELLRRAPRAAGWPLFDAITERGRGPVEVAVLGSGPVAEELIKSAWRHAPAGSTVIGVPEPVPGFAVLEGKSAINGQPTAYVCQDFTCQRPVHTLDGLVEQLS